MKKTVVSLGLAVLVSLCAAGLELNSSIAMGNMFFNTGRSTAIGAAEGSFTENWAYSANLSAVERIGENVTFSAGFERDAVLRNEVFTRVGFDAGFAKLAVGPFFGPFNVDGSVLTSGISTSLRLEMPGVMFGSFRSDSSIGAGLAAPGDYVQEKSEILVGFWVPNIMISARLASESFTFKKLAALTTVDERTRYEFIFDIYKKNLPYTVRLNFGYENLMRSYVYAADSDDDEIGAAIIGMDVAMQLNEAMKVSAGAEGALYVWGIGDIGSPSTNAAMYTIRVGLTWNIPTNTAAMLSGSGGN
jgi:hypothetical protein